MSRRGRGAVISFFGESRREYGLTSFLYEIIFALLANTLQCPHHPLRPALPIPTLTAPYAKLLPASANGRLPSDTWALTRTLSTLWLHLLIQYFNYLWGHYCSQALFSVLGDSSEQNRPRSCAHSAYLISVELFPNKTFSC